MKCGQPCEVWSRAVGYYRPTQDWNEGKRAEFKARKTYEVDEEKLIKESEELETQS